MTKAKVKVHLVHLSGPILGLFVRDRKWNIFQRSRRKRTQILENKNISSVKGQGKIVDRMDKEGSIFWYRAFPLTRGRCRPIFAGKLRRCFQWKKKQCFLVIPKLFFVPSIPMATIVYFVSQAVDMIRYEKSFVKIWNFLNRSEKPIEKYFVKIKNLICGSQSQNGKGMTSKCYVNLICGTH